MLRGMDPRGSSAWVSWIRTWFQKQHFSVIRVNQCLSKDNFFVRKLETNPSISDLLEVDELGLVGVEQEAAAVVAHRIAADARLRVLKLLLDVPDDTLAVQAQKDAGHQFGMYRVCAYHLPADANQRADAQRGQLADPGEPQRKKDVTEGKLFAS